MARAAGAQLLAPAAYPESFNHFSTHTMQDVIQLLRDLGAKLDTTAANIWRILIQQAAIAAWMDIAQVVLLGILLFASAKWCRWNVKNYPKWRSEHSIYAEPAQLVISCILTGIISIVFIAVAIFSLQDAATAIANPEYWALHHLLNR